DCPSRALRSSANRPVMCVPAWSHADASVGGAGRTRAWRSAVVMADRLDLESERIAPKRGEVRLRILRELLRGMHVDTPEAHGDFVRVTDGLTRRHHERQMLQAGPAHPVGSGIARRLEEDV